MPTRDDLIDDILKAQESSLPGRAGQVSRDDLINDILSAQEAKEPSSGSDKFETGVRSYLEGQTLGLTEPLIGGANAVVGNLIDAGFDSEGLGDFLSRATDWDKIKEGYGKDIERRKALKAKNPGLDAGAQITGALVPAVATLGQSALVHFGKAAPTAANAARAGSILDAGGTVASAASKGADKVLGGVAKLAKLDKITNPLLVGAGKIAAGGAKGAAAGVTSELARQQILQSSGYMDPSEAPDVSDVALTSAKWGAGLSALPQAYKAAKYLGKRGMSVALGPKVEVIDKYLENAARINNARTEDDLKIEINKLAKQLQDDVDNGMLSKKEAKEVEKAIQLNINQVRTEATQEFSRTKYDASRAVDRARDNFKDVVKGQEAALKGVRAPLDISGDVETAKRTLKDLVVKGSQEAVETLPENGTVDLSKAYKAAKAVRDRLDIGGIGPATTPAKASRDEIDKFLALFGAHPSQVSMRGAKEIIRQLDDAGKATYGRAGEFDDAVGRAYKTARAVLDEQLKAHAPYAEKMSEVAQMSKLLDSITKKFPDQKATQSKILGLHRPQSNLDYQDLSALASATGSNFVGDVDEYVKAQQLLANRRKLESMAANTPEFSDWQAKEARLERLQHPDAGRQFVDGAVKASGLSDDLAAAQQRAKVAEDLIAQAQARKDRVGVNEGTGESIVNQLMREKKPFNARDAISRVDSEFGTKLAQDIDDRRVLDSFSKGNTNGSRNVNLFAIGGNAVGIGTTLGGVGGAMAGPFGAAVGALAGAAIDKYGPQMAKGILDAVLTIQGTPTIQKIQALNLPPNVKNYLSAQLVRHQGETIRSGGMGRAAQNQTPFELDRDSSQPAQYEERVDENEAQQRFLKGN